MRREGSEVFEAGPQLKKKKMILADSWLVYLFSYSTYIST